MKISSGSGIAREDSNNNILVGNKIGQVGISSIVIGNGASSYDNIYPYSNSEIAIGNNARSNGSSTIVIGNNSYAVENTDNSLLIGNWSYNGNDGCILIGNGSSNYNLFSSTFGSYISNSIPYSFLFGNNNQSYMTIGNGVNDHSEYEQGIIDVNGCMVLNPYSRTLFSADLNGVNKAIDFSMRSILLINDAVNDAYGQNVCVNGSMILGNIIQESVDAAINASGEAINGYAYAGETQQDYTIIAYKNSTDPNAGDPFIAAQNAQVSVYSEDAYNSYLSWEGGVYADGFYILLNDTYQDVGSTSSFTDNGTGWIEGSPNLDNKSPYRYIPAGLPSVVLNDRNNANQSFIYDLTVKKLRGSNLPTSPASIDYGDLWVDTTGGLNIVKMK